MPDPQVQLPALSNLLAVLAMITALAAIVMLFINTELFAPLLGAAYALRMLASWWAGIAIKPLLWVCLALCVLLSLAPASG